MSNDKQTGQSAGQNPLKELVDQGVSLWLDDLSRDRINSGNLQELINTQYISGVTTNPTIFAGALSSGDAYNAQVAELAARGAQLEDVVTTLTTDDVRNAADVFRPVWEATGGVDGRVSIEVDPRLAHDTDKTVAQAKELAKIVDRPNVLIKIPATKEGLPAITAVLAEGISVNVTLIFSLERYGEVIDAFMEGIKRAKESGHNIAELVSVASFFVSRVDTEVDKRLDELGTPEAKALRGQAAIANARLAFQLYEERFGAPEWQELAAAGAKPQRPLWASTGVKDKAYDDTRYVTELVTAGTVNTAPEKTIQAVADHGVITGDTIRGNYGQASSVFSSLEAVGIDLNDVFDVLEREGVEKFDKSWAELLATVGNELSKAAKGSQDGTSGDGSHDADTDQGTAPAKDAQQ
ncbi:transaldolase [Nakamurella aerolata]|uniref:Transaldolase n=1 Tax=Nakamurella aerolata TaxID=1656892 RepID=A0A848ZZP1_9ACTN|nr:transaldolase [Nakamurella aerolata]NNG34284.1 transaldolase [Nakamurella aerolata]